jgi:hypothetical protein
MYTDQSFLQHMLPGEPTPEALFREEFFNEKSTSDEEGEAVTDHTLVGKAQLLRAQLVSSVGRYLG